MWLTGGLCDRGTWFRPLLLRVETIKGTGAEKMPQTDRSELLDFKGASERPSDRLIYRAK